jgi:S-adenosylmethionine synthetase
MIFGEITTSANVNYEQVTQQTIPTEVGSHMLFQGLIKNVPLMTEERIGCLSHLLHKK